MYIVPIAWYYSVQGYLDFIIAGFRWYFLYIQWCWLFRRLSQRPGHNALQQPFIVSHSVMGNEECRYSFKHSTFNPLTKLPIGKIWSTARGTQSPLNIKSISCSMSKWYSSSIAITINEEQNLTLNSLCLEIVALLWLKWDFLITLNDTALQFVIWRYQVAFIPPWVTTIKLSNTRNCATNRWTMPRVNMYCPVHAV